MLVRSESYYDFGLIVFLYTLCIFQVDLVPSLAVALGVPIPYSNLGHVMEEILATVGMTQEEADTKHTQALSLNIKQVQRYLTAYRYGELLNL